VPEKLGPIIALREQVQIVVDKKASVFSFGANLLSFLENGSF